MKKRFGKIAYAILCATLAFDFYACGGDNGSAVTEDPTSSSSEEKSVQSSSSVIDVSGGETSSSGTASSSSEIASSGASSSNSETSSSSAISSSSVVPSSSSQSGNVRLLVDAENQTLVANIDEDVGICQAQNHIVNYRTVRYTQNDVVYHYRLWGDTLVLLDTDYESFTQDRSDWEDYIGDYSTVLVGGGNDSPYGTWQVVPNCHYDFFNNKTVCSEPKDENGKTWAVEISRDGITSKIVGADGSAAKGFDDYTNSVFMKYLYEHLSGTGGLVGFDEFGFNYHMFEDWTKYMAEVQQKAGIEILSRTSTKVTFVLKNQEYSFEVTEVKNEGAYNRSFSAVLSSNGKSCSTRYNSMSGFAITSDMCRIDNDRIPGYTDEMDFDGETVEYIEHYIYSDNREFMECAYGLDE